MAKLKPNAPTIAVFSDLRGPTGFSGTAASLVNLTPLLATWKVMFSSFTMRAGQNMFPGLHPHHA